MGTVFYVIAAIFLLGVMVTVHEWGHFIAARMTGIPVKEFAIGFGKLLVSWHSKKHGTKFSLRLIPAGGFCAFYGEDDASGKEKDDPRNIANHKVWKRMLTILLGPVMNFVLALIVSVGLYAVMGEPTVDYGYAVIQSVTEGSPAEQAGILPMDKITAVNGVEAKGLTADETSLAVQPLIAAYKEGDDPLMLSVQRGENNLEIQVIPLFDAQEGRPLMGVTLAADYAIGYAPVSFFRAVTLGADYCVRAGGAILEGLGKMITTGEGFSESSGPVGIVQIIAEETQKSGWVTYLELLVIISVNLGLFNLIPIPGLDGSRLVFLAIEGIRRKPVPQKVEATVHLCGYLLLIGLMAVMTFKDVLNIFR
ncbi:MAG: PDZ domain-containing protein [Clostridiales bacterium]|nr:PDZ domain-containing protein [Clostridiales bacterium]